MSTETEVDYITIDDGGLAWIKGTGMSVGDLLALLFLYGWRDDELLECIPEFTSEAINAALTYAAENPETVEGQFYYSLDPVALMRAVGLL